MYLNIAHLIPGETKHGYWDFSADGIKDVWPTLVITGGETDVVCGHGILILISTFALGTMSVTGLRFDVYILQIFVQEHLVTTWILKHL